MNIQTINTGNNETLWPGKLYSRQDVNTTLQEQEKRLAQVEKIQEETKIVNSGTTTDKKTTENLVKKSNRILATISTHKFPFDLFPDTVNIEEGRITVITRTFFNSSRVHSVDIKDVSNIFINIAPFFAQLVIVSKTFSQNEIKIRNLKKDEAVFARRIIEGLRIFENKQIDTSIYTKQELITKLEELSTTEIVT